MNIGVCNGYSIIKHIYKSGVCSTNIYSREKAKIIRKAKNSSAISYLRTSGKRGRDRTKIPVKMKDKRKDGCKIKDRTTHAKQQIHPM